MSRRTLGTGLALALLVLGACAGEEREDPILRLSAEESLEQGNELMAKEKYALAREYLQHAFEVEPNSAIGREALLLVADTHFLQGGFQNHVRAEAKYRDFQNRFPTSSKAAYVQYQIAASLAKRMRPPDRDQSITRQALEAFEDVIRVFPTSDYVVESREQMIEIRQRLAESEFLKGRFNQKLRLHLAAVDRFEDLLEVYPEYREIDKVLFYLSESLEKLERAEDAEEARQRLRDEHPDSEYLAELEKGP